MEQSTYQNLLLEFEELQVQHPPKSEDGPASGPA